MKRFTQLFCELDQTTRTNEKVAALEDYFRSVPEPDAAWALQFLCGRTLPRAVPTKTLWQLILDETKLPEWLIRECYDAVGDMAESIALLLRDSGQGASLSLSEMVEQRIVPLRMLPEHARRNLIVTTWRELDSNERLVWNKLVTGNFRIGVARTLVIRALANVAKIEPAIMAHRIMGSWQPTAADFNRLVNSDVTETAEVAKPYPFFLASPLEIKIKRGEDIATLGDLPDWFVEWKWDGIRAQMIRRSGETLIWSRGDEMVTDAFPELVEAGQHLPEGTVLDGEILAWRGDRPLSFGKLQRRLGRKQVGMKTRSEFPIVFLAYDLLELAGKDLRTEPLAARRKSLEEILARLDWKSSPKLLDLREAAHTPLLPGFEPGPASEVQAETADISPLRLSPLIQAGSWKELAAFQSEARDRGVEGLMLKNKLSVYGVGRQRGDWWKWKIDPLVIDAVMISAQMGHGRRANLYTDYTFGLWDNGQLVPVAKAYSGLTDEEILEVDTFVRRNTTGKFGPVRAVEPLQVFELAFEGIQKSSRHKSGIAVRFPRMNRWRKDKKPAEADTLENLRALADFENNLMAQILSSESPAEDEASIVRENALNQLLAWFKRHRWKPFQFQLEAWSDYLAGRSGLIHAPTGMGKTYAVSVPPLVEWLMEFPDESAWPKSVPLRVLWITPLRALANDTAKSILAPINDLELPWTVELRTGDTSSSIRAKQRERFPSVLVTTPESLSLLLSYPGTQEKMASLKSIVVDEWHDLIGTKRGVQAELCLARLRTWFPNLRTWGLSATLGNLDEALAVLMGKNSPAARLIAGDFKKRVEVQTVLPRNVENFPWAGHLGLNLLPQILKFLERKKTTLLFTNTRSQTEIWFQTLLKAKPEWANEIALHHGSIGREARSEVEQRLRDGTIRCVVCTASLDLGVDFSPVQQVIQIGAPKGVARMLQRAGRSGHQPNGVSRIVCVPAHALELVEFSAVRDAIAAGDLESRLPLEHPLDVLVQHLVTVALGSGFDEKALLAEVRTSHAYRNLTDEEWQWCMDFVTRGGHALKVYPQFSRVNLRDGVFTVPDPFIARLHRMSVGTITSDSAVAVRVVRGAMLGTVEESFIGKFRPGDKFSFAGNMLELVRIRDMTAYVRRSKKASGVVPQWMGGRMPLSSQLARMVRQKLADANAGNYSGPEMLAVKPVLEIQSHWSRIPLPDELLIERIQMRDGVHHFIFPFAGRLVHEGLAALIAHRVSRLFPSSIAVTLNDYGFALLSATSLSLGESEWQKVFSKDNLLDDLLGCLNSAELARRQFREIARIAGLVFQGYPGSGKSTRQLQSSSGLFFDVFQRYDPQNLLLEQARREVLERQLEVSRLGGTLAEIAAMKIVRCEIPRLTPLSFPLWASFVQANVTSEKWADRVKRMAMQLQNVVEEENAGAKK